MELVTEAERTHNAYASVAWPDVVVVAIVAAAVCVLAWIFSKYWRDRL